MTPLIHAALTLTLLANALMAGVYFAFSAFIMPALATDPRAGIAAMNAINRVILRSLFMPLFFGTTLASLALAVLAALDLSAPGAPAMLAGGILYVVGMFSVTAACNVPLNDRLAAEPTEAVWAAYRTRWTRWNHVRTAASLGSAALLLLALVQRLTPASAAVIVAP